MLLQVIDAVVEPASLPPSLAGLPHLQLCQLSFAYPQFGYAAAAPLPGGPWLHSLRWLSIGISSLMRSTAVLRAATALECISIVHSPAAATNWHSPAASTLFDWLARHPPLRRLSIQADCSLAPFSSVAFAAQVRWLRSRRPALWVQHPDLGEVGESLSSFLNRAHPF